MDKDPYSVLGVSRSATDDEIKSAYRALAKKYHPDTYVGSPLEGSAEERMSEINAAYDRITEERKNGYSSYGSRRSYGSSYSGGYRSATRFPDIRAAVGRGDYDAAEAMLDAVAESERGAEWCFLMGSVYYARGWLEQAADMFARAARSEPNNPEYVSAYNRTVASRRYGPYTRSSGNGDFCGDSTACAPCDICGYFLCADCLCNCLCNGC